MIAVHIRNQGVVSLPSKSTLCIRENVDGSACESQKSEQWRNLYCSCLATQLFPNPPGKKPVYYMPAIPFWIVARKSGEKKCQGATRVSGSLCARACHSPQPGAGQLGSTRAALQQVICICHSNIDKQIWHTHPHAHFSTEQVPFCNFSTTLHFSYFHTINNTSSYCTSV